MAKVANEEAVATSQCSQGEVSEVVKRCGIGSLSTRKIDTPRGIDKKVLPTD